MTAYTTWAGPITTTSTAAAVDQMWNYLMLTTTTGKQYAAKDQPNTGYWGKAKALKDQLKNQ